MGVASEKIVIVGAGPQALFLVREFSRQNYHVILVGRKNEIAMYSKFAQKIPVRSEEHLVLELNLLASINSKLKAYVASGFYLAFLMNHFPKFFQIFNTSPGHKSSIYQLMNKAKTYELAENAGVLFPKSVLLAEINSDQLNYPQIVKWNSDIYLFTKPEFKTCLIKNNKELDALLKRLTDEEKKALIAQDFLGADLKNNLSYGAYVENGEIKLGICVNEVRHYRSGVSSVVEEYSGHFATEIQNQAALILNQTQFTGFLDVEFKIFERKLYLLEVNPRPFGFIKIMKKKYPDLIPYIMGKKTVVIKNPEKVKWINVLRDMVVIIKNPREVLHLLKVLFDFKKRTFDVWDISDPLPFFYQLKR